MTLQELTKSIEEGNEEFKKLSKSEKRVKIAEDCIERIKIGQLRAKSGAILDIEVFDDSTLPVKKLLENGNFTCDVCAKGSMFLSYVGRVNKFNSNEIDGECNNHNTVEIKKLLEIFTERQLVLIEAAFEGNQWIYKDLKGKDIDIDNIWGKIDAFRFGTTSDERIIKICQNIIDNKGTFKL